MMLLLTIQIVGGIILAGIILADAYRIVRRRA